MTTVRLLPINHSAPSCESFSNASAVRAFERAVRVHRAFTEPFTIAAVDGRANGAYRVAGAARGAYVVDIVDATGRHDACTCPDFLVNELGTCKHLEAVRRALQANDRTRPVRGRVPSSAAAPTLTVAADGALGLRLCGEWSYRQLAALELSSPGAATWSRWAAASPLPPACRATAFASSTRHRPPRPASPHARHGHGAPQLSPRRSAPTVPASTCSPSRSSRTSATASPPAVGGRALLADDMGLGKTVQAIAACEVLLRAGRGAAGGRGHAGVAQAPVGAGDRALRRAPGGGPGQGPAARREALRVGRAVQGAVATS